MRSDQEQPRPGARPHGRSRQFFMIGQIIGVVSGAATCLLWLLTLWDPASVFSFSTLSYLVVFFMILISIIAVLASIKGHGVTLIVLFAMAFFPIGLYVIAVPHWIRWVGLANVGFLLAGVLIRQFGTIDRRD